MTLKLELTKEEANIIMMGLGELPSKIAHNLINKLQMEFHKQSGTEVSDSNTETNAE